MATQILVRQKHSDGCGAACLAMLLSISYKQARLIFPGYTSLQGMKNCLANYADLPEYRLLLVGNESKQHWVLFADGLYFDPAMAFVKSKLNKKYAGILASIQL